MNAHFLMKLFKSFPYTIKYDTTYLNNGLLQYQQVMHTVQTKQVINFGNYHKVIHIDLWTSYSCICKPQNQGWPKQEDHDDPVLLTWSQGFEVEIHRQNCTYVPNYIDRKVRRSRWPRPKLKSSCKMINIVQISIL